MDGSYSGITFSETAKLFSKVVEHFQVPPSLYETVALPSLQPWAQSVSLNLVILVGVLWYVLGVLICTSLMINDIGHLFM